MVNIPYVLACIAWDNLRGYTGSDLCNPFLLGMGRGCCGAKESCWPGLRQEEPRTLKQDMQRAFVFIRKFWFSGKNGHLIASREKRHSKFSPWQYLCPFLCLYWLRSSHILPLDLLLGTRWTGSAFQFYLSTFPQSATSLHLLLVLSHHSDLGFFQTAVAPCSALFQ